MSNYDFLNLSPIEFEDLTHDLLQKAENILFESFTPGKDSGIDLRYSCNFENNIIIQCKKYKDYNTLLSNIKKESNKIQKLNPKRYILATSVGLTPNNKEKISEILRPYITNYSDIIGKDDLNNLIGRYPDIEKKHFKLWLSSTNILNQIIHSKTHNYSLLEETKIRECVSFYVNNDSFSKALQIIKDNNFVIISGIPGIGKTTLARMLVYHFLALFTDPFEEFIFLSDSISQAYELFHLDKRQVFLFDDFLGTNFLEDKLQPHEDQRIIRFITQINETKNKILILTTREYILNQAKIKYEKFGNNKDIEIAKCIIDLSTYTELVKAKILYNHLYFSDMPYKYIEKLLENNNYIEIINHKNYNPRIIERITTKNLWKDIKYEDFYSKFIELLNNPEDIWKHAYENQILSLSRSVLALILTTGTPILHSDMLKLTENFYNINKTKYNKFDSFEFKNTIKELENTFIVVNKDAKDNLIIEFENPSIHDFLINYLNNDNSFCEDIIQSIIFINQFFKIFTIGKDIPKKISLTDKLKDSFISKLINDFNVLETSELVRISIGNGMVLYKQDINIVKKIYKILINIENIESYPQLKQLLIDSFDKISLINLDIYYYINILNKLKSFIQIDIELLHILSNSLETIDDLIDFKGMYDIFPDEYDKLIKEDSFIERVSNIVCEYEFDVDLDSLDVVEMLKNIKIIEKEYNLSNIISDNIETLLQEKQEKYESDMEAREDWKEQEQPLDDSNSKENVEKHINDMFDSLNDDSIRYRGLEPNGD